MLENGLNDFFDGGFLGFQHPYEFELLFSDGQHTFEWSDEAEVSITINWSNCLDTTMEWEGYFSIEEHPNDIYNGDYFFMDFWN